jgi:hypothetical protein
MHEQKSNSAIAMAQTSGLPRWLATMRAAAMNAITHNDVDGIVKKQVALAKDGDPIATKFVMDFVLGITHRQEISAACGFVIVPDSLVGTVRARPGTPDKIAAMQARAETGIPLTLPGDGPDVDLE